MSRLAEHYQLWPQEMQQPSHATRACRAQADSLLLMLPARRRASSSSTLRFMIRALG